MSRTRYKILHEDTAPYFLTLTTVGFLPLFSDPNVAQFLLDSLRYLSSSGALVLYAYVIMENHSHIVSSSENLRSAISRFKSYTARRGINYFTDMRRESVIQQLRSNGHPKKTGRTFQFWQEGSFPKRILSEEMMRQKITYIHYNPVRRGYVDHPEHWRYSSARNYAGGEGLIDVCMEW